MEGQFYLLIPIIILAAYTDLRNQIIPNILTMTASIAGLFYHTFDNGVSGFIFSMIGMAVGFGIFIVLYLVKAVGAGDVKLFAAIGSITGIQFVLHTSLYSILYAGLIGVVIIFYRKEFVRKAYQLFIHLLQYGGLSGSSMTVLKKDSYHFPFMYAVLPGVVTSIYYYLI